MITWDRTLLTPAEAGPPYLMPSNTSGGPGQDGTEQIVSIVPPRWAIQFNAIALNTAAKIKYWNQTAARAQGRLNPLVVPIFDKQRAPAVAVTTRADAAVASGATTMTIRLVGNTNNLLEEGMFFSWGGKRLYVITSIDSRTVSGSDKLFAVEIMPPIREAIASSDPLEFNDPVLQVRLATDDAMKPNPLQAFRVAEQKVLFYEDC